jgi:hypothetical protein
VSYCFPVISGEKQKTPLFIDADARCSRTNRRRKRCWCGFGSADVLGVPEMQPIQKAKSFLKCSCNASGMNLQFEVCPACGASRCANCEGEATSSSQVSICLAEKKKEKEGKQPRRTSKQSKDHGIIQPCSQMQNASKKPDSPNLFSIVRFSTLISCSPQASKMICIRLHEKGTSQLPR